MLNSVAVAELRPTQITVGLREVAEKRTANGTPCPTPIGRPSWLAT